jgi:hypothetical protein
MRKRYGLLTERQYEVLKLRIQGYTQEEIAKILKTSRENISITEKRAKEKIRLAEETLRIYKELLSSGVVNIEAGTHLVEVPQLVVAKADKLGIKLRANFTMLYDEIRYRAGKCIEGTRVVKPIKVIILRDGTFEVSPCT